MTHEQMQQLVTQNNNPGVAYAAGDDWKNLGGQLREAAITLDAAINGSQSHWEGAAADLARAHLAKVRDWSADTAEYFHATGTAMHDQVDAAAKAKADMPQPVDFDPAKMIEQAAGNPIAMLTLPVTMYATYEASTSAKDKAVQVMQTRDASLAQAAAAIPAFTPPPDISDGSSASTQVASAGPVGAGGGVAAYHGTAGGGGGYTGGSYHPGAGGGGYTPASSVPGGGGYSPGQVGAAGGGGPTRIAGYDPGVGGPGFNGPGYNAGPGGPNGPYGGGPGGGGAPGLGIAGGFGPGGGGGGTGGGAGYRGGAGAAGGSSSSTSSAKPGAGSQAGAGAMGEEGAGARGGMGAAGGNAGGAGMGAGGRGGKKEEDKEHKRPTFLVETDDVFGDGQMVAPTVIGENPTGGY
jgi:hypothetical protein